MSPPPRRARLLRLAFTLFFLPYALICLAFYLLQERLLFLPSSQLACDPSSVGLSHEEVEIESDGQRIHGWYLQHPASRGSVLFLHGNAGNISHRMETLLVLHQLGLSVLIVDYPGYGKSSGKPGEQACVLAARAAFGELARRSPAELPLIVWGRSLGGGVASALVDEQGLDLLVLESTFTSVPDIAQDVYPWLPAHFLASLSFPSEELVRGIGLPLLVIHSREDDLVPFSHGEALYAAGGAKATLIPIRGSHNGGFITSGADYTGPVSEFLALQFGGGQSGPLPPREE